MKDSTHKSITVSDDRLSYDRWADTLIPDRPY